MKNNHKVVVIALSLIITLVACSDGQAGNSQSPVQDAQEVSTEHAMPDLSGHEAKLGEMEAVLNGREVALKMSIYFFVDWNKLERYYIQIICKEDGSPWLALERKEIGEKRANGETGTKEYQYFLFESDDAGVSWGLAKEFKVSQDWESMDSELVKLMKDKYNLERAQ